MARSPPSTVPRRINSRRLIIDGFALRLMLGILPPGNAVTMAQRLVGVKDAISNR
jgi:hypothetical protein